MSSNYGKGRKRGQEVRAEMPVLYHIRFRARFVRTMNDGQWTIHRSSSVFHIDGFRSRNPNPKNSENFHISNN